MQISTQAIVINKLKFQDYHLIITCYTREFGIVNYLLKYALKAKKNNKVGYFQLLAPIEINTIHKANKNLQIIKDVKFITPINTIYSYVIKTTIALFLSEVLYNSIKEENANQELFNYVFASITWLDLNSNISNFHILFLINLTKYLGFYPDINNNHYLYFNLQTGQFQSNKNGMYTIEGKNLTLLKTFLGITFDALQTVKINAQERYSFLRIILMYFELHLEGFKAPKSLDVFKAVFS